ncbi:Relaxase/Mobilisation nuclease domain-containing protein [Propionispira arboris]|uniref:Relaxase/Mobilisation nuclease domain-containing protein n=1 Tax=Propionispira arboris TaxID=84035 RepID=A0A1H6ZR06_9FIRM|nr:Relaxase/Mobilisation nuclease domain-containing protein [Propionispira arboris]
MIVSVFKVISNENNTPEILYDKIIYIMNHSATQLDYIYGVNVNPFMAYKEMIFAKKVFGKMQGNAFLHFVLSFDNEDKINFSTIMEVGKKIGYFLAYNNIVGSHQVLLAMHTGTDNVHFHFLMNTIDIKSGARIDLWKPELYAMKDRISEILQSYDLSTIRKYTLADFKTA